MIRRFSAAFASTLLAGLSAAATPAQTAAPPPPDTTNFPPKMQSVPLYGDAAIPNSKPGPDQETSTDGTWIKKVSRPFMQIYLPARAKATGAGIVIFPGGCYAGLTFDFEGTQQASFFIDHGIAAFVVRYRIPMTRPWSINPWARSRMHSRRCAFAPACRRMERRPRRIGVIGFSAGGHVASTLATHFDKSYVDNPDHVDLRPSFLVLVYPVISMDAKITHMDSRKALLGAEPSESNIRFFSNELHVTRSTPPTLILHAADDRLVDVDNSIVFFEALRHAGVPVETRLFQKGQHGFFLLPRDRWQTAIMDWLASSGWLSPRAN